MGALIVAVLGTVASAQMPVDVFLRLHLKAAVVGILYPVFAPRSLWNEHREPLRAPFHRAGAGNDVFEVCRLRDVDEVHFALLLTVFECRGSAQGSRTRDRRAGRGAAGFYRVVPTGITTGLTAASAGGSTTLLTRRFRSSRTSRLSLLPRRFCFRAWAVGCSRTLAPASS